MTRMVRSSGEQQRVSSNQGQLKIWGRANSVNVQKVLWCLRELDLTYERMDAGMAFGRNTEAGYLAMNPNGRVPTMVDGDFVLWESNSVMRYLVLAYGKGSTIYPSEPKRRAGVDRWLDWTLSTLQPVDRPVFWALVRTPVERRDMIQLLIHQETRGRLFHVSDHADRRRMGAMRRSKSIVDVDVAQGRQLFGELRIVLFFFGVEAQILQQQNFAGFGQNRMHLRTDAIWRHRYWLAQKFREPLGARRQAHLGVRFALGTS
jgi:glutathione S-transferase